ncbi:MAG: hypothetical protein GKR94_27620 [Gammaproteobacteria bacterium]|nr:hypothetical protein [Gammaproteobacteria bacterium]
MNELEQIEQNIESLSPRDLEKFREWFIAFDWRLWDTKIEQDLKSGKLDKLISEAKADYEAGKAREL